MKSAYDAVRTASLRPEASPRDCERANCSANATTYYAFDSSSLEPIGEPSPVRPESDGSQTTIEAVRRGTIVVTDRSDPAGESYYVLRDRPGVSSTEIESIDQEGDAVIASFTDQGERAFASLTRTVARRGARACAEILGVPCGTQPRVNVESLAQTYAVVVDGELITRQAVNFAEPSDGIQVR